MEIMELAYSKFLELNAVWSTPYSSKPMNRFAQWLSEHQTYLVDDFYRDKWPMFVLVLSSN